MPERRRSLGVHSTILAQTLHSVMVACFARSLPVVTKRTRSSSFMLMRAISSSRRAMSFTFHAHPSHLVEQACNVLHGVEDGVGDVLGAHRAHDCGEGWVGDCTLRPRAARCVVPDSPRASTSAEVEHHAIAQSAERLLHSLLVSDEPVGVLHSLIQ